MPNGAHHSFTPAGFAMTVVRVVGFLALLCIVVMTLAYFLYRDLLSTNFNANLSFAIAVFLYLSFVAGWGIAYHKYFRFPKNQKVLLLGVGIGAFILPVVGGAIGLVTGEMNISETLQVFVQGGVLGGILGAALQMYLLVIVLRYLFPRRLPF